VIELARIGTALARPPSTPCCAIWWRLPCGHRAPGVRTPVATPWGLAVPCRFTSLS